MAQSPLDLQLKETSQLTGASRAIWLEHSVEWEILAAYHLSSREKQAVLKGIQRPEMQAWIEAAFTASHPRSRSGDGLAGFEAGRIHLFADQMTQRVILVGADHLSSVAQRFWQFVAVGNISRPFLEPSADPFLSSKDLAIPYHLPEALARILDLLLRTAGCKAGWLAIRSGDYFEIRAEQGCGDWTDKRISIEANPLLRDLLHNCRGEIVQKEAADWAMVPRIGYNERACSWAALPLVIGSRLIGLAGIWLEEPLQNEVWTVLKQLTRKIAPSVEASITFSDLTNQLRRMALLNDFAVTITSALNPEQIAQRMFALLRRAFGTDRIHLNILSSDGSVLSNYVEHEGTVTMNAVLPEKGHIPWLVQKGEVYRVDAIGQAGEYSPVYEGSQSTLVIPLKFRRQIIGALGLESTKNGAFTVYDEHLLMVIASHVAGLLENGRLRREAESRANNLSMIHEVVEQIINLTDVQQVAQIASELMAKYFAYELAAIILIEGPERRLNVAGIGGNAAEVVRKGLIELEERSEGIVMRVAMTGENMLVQDVSQNPFYQPIPQWQAGSEMCVALRDGENILGVIDVESRRKNAFSQNDLLVLESLAGIVSGVILSAGQYQKLQATVDQLRATREELQERIAVQKTTESKLVQAAKLAAVGEMAAGIAHELNNPLTSVSGFTELILDEMPRDSKYRNDLELVFRESQRARGVVRRLLDFARQSESVRVRSDVNEILEEVLALVNHLLRTSGIILKTSFAKGIPWVSVDRNQTKQVVLNLIHNALHAMPTGGELRIATLCQRRDERDWLTISLADTGMGIAPENLDKVFEPFFTTRSKDGGTGLGLSVSYGIIADHGGFIEVESEVGEGSSFTIWLPIEVE